MAKKKKAPTKTMVAAVERLAGLKSIDPNLDMGEGLKISDYFNRMKSTDAKLEKYNTGLSLADGYLNEFNAEEKLLKDIHERMLIAVAAKYGKDSDEYEKAGGVRKSERKKPTKKKKKDDDEE